MLSWGEMADSLQSLGQLVIRMRDDGSWYAKCEGVGLGDGGGVLGVFGNGRNPEEAIKAYWECLTTLDRGGERYKWVQVGRGENRRGYRWDGKMWQLAKECR